MSQDAGYRQRIYGQYLSRIKGAPVTLDVAVADRWGRPYRHYLRGWLPERRDVAVVDLGCGEGRLLRFFVQQSYTNVRGVDRGAEQVATARGVHDRVEQGDVFEFLRGKTGCFELITALDLVEHLRKEEVLEFLDLCRRALAPGGRLILQTPNADSPLVGSVRYGDFTHEVCFQTDSLRGLLELAGFQEVQTRECGPVALGLMSAMRVVAWRLLRCCIKVWNLVETGSSGSGVYTRVFLISGLNR